MSMDMCPVCGADTLAPWLTNGPTCDTCKAKVVAHEAEYKAYVRAHTQHRPIDQGLYEY